MSKGLHRQAPAGEDATEAGLAGATGMGLDLHTDLDIGSFPAVVTETPNQSKEARWINQVREGAEQGCIDTYAAA